MMFVDLYTIRFLYVFWGSILRLQKNDDPLSQISLALSSLCLGFDFYLVLHFEATRESGMKPEATKSIVHTELI